jgi:ketosteroid isomerase-like protein
MARAAVMRSAVLAAVLTSCAGPRPAPPDLGAAEKAIRAADARWLQAVKARDAAAEAALFARDGTAYRAHIEPLVGPAAFQSYAARQYAANPRVSLTWTTDAIHVAASGDIAVQTGTYHIAGLGPRGDGQDRGNFVTIWKKVGGAWKVWDDIGSSTTPAAPTASTAHARPAGPGA